MEEGAHPECYKGRPNRKAALEYYKEAQRIGDLKEAVFKLG